MTASAVNCTLFVVFVQCVFTQNVVARNIKETCVYDRIIDILQVLINTFIVNAVVTLNGHNDAITNYALNGE